MSYSPRARVVKKFSALVVTMSSTRIPYAASWRAISCADSSGLRM